MIKSTINTACLHSLGIDVWLPRRDTELIRTQLQALENKVAVCTQCPLYHTRTHTVFARGNPEAPLLIIGSAPGHQADKQGIPFSGKTGTLLDNMLRSVGISSEQYYMVNLIKCKPQNPTSPDRDAIARCHDFLTQQLNILQPRLILGLGSVVREVLTYHNAPLQALPSQRFHYHNIPCHITQDPGALLQTPKTKRHSYYDLILVKKYLDSL